MENKELIKSATDTTPIKTLHAFYMEPINGGYQLHRLTIQEDIVLSDDKVEDPDGWPETLGYLEKEFTLEHFQE